mmetsp:Transcript_12703/g.27530  ORF Transcript_12703/g.27530 Transcript_12703/m.27530 type:complete len:127 (+) Transcript_12703:72-452(+)|eukprot:CAMPEP_0202903924 /NCGR_PEP_ID=MMETSP1392-20130828/27223_1 /ASSEMBLY_ACC=CAM_ASM_000868 /TAXON_ID=225041 /ORGANISM="Chlamydomonas chlamydogama, Strain SAG 11-48b" /LENGTH=126 /DNA_ID=CAMNT_0049591317 /DNA_START=68 /DNA_END=448 /DNA_ORIENTATION=+
MSTALIVHPKFTHTLPKGPTRHCFFNKLPYDALHVVATNVAATAQDLLRFEQVSKRCRRAASDDTLWKRLCVSKFSIPDGCRPPSWRALYRFNHEFLRNIILASSAETIWRMNGFPMSAFRISVFA